MSARRHTKTSGNTLSRLAPLFTAKFRKISDGCELAEQFREQRQTVVANCFVVRHDHHAVEKLIDDLSKASNDFQRFLILPRALLRLHFCGGFPNRGIEVPFVGAFEQLRSLVASTAGIHVGPFWDLSNLL